MLSMPDDTSGTWDLIASPWHLDGHIPDFPVPVGTVAVADPPLPDGAIPGRMNVVHQAVADAVAGVARPLLLSGDCPAALGVAAALQRRHREIAVVWLDAHGDFNTPAITISGYLGGMPVAMLTGRAPQLFAGPPGLRFPAGPGPSLGDVGNCLAAITASADVVAASFACAWLPGQVGRPFAREAITQLAGALGRQLTWPPGDTQDARPA
jgi:arginase family enzyme